MELGPLAPISTEAMEAIDKIANILQSVPKEEWLFVLTGARNKATEMCAIELAKNINKLLRQTLKNIKRQRGKKY